MASAIGVRIDDVGSTLKFRIGFPFGENSACFCQSVWLPGSMLKFRVGSVSSIGGLIAATLFADTVSDSQTSDSEEPSMPKAADCAAKDPERQGHQTRDP